MFQYISQLLAFAILAAGIGLAYIKWVRPLGALDLPERGAMLLTLLAMIGGLAGSIFWWIDEPRSFAWDLPPLASRMLAAAGFSFFVLCMLAVRRPSLHRLRLVMLNLFVYLAPLVVVIVLFHLNRFDPTKPITYSFFATALVMSVASGWYLLRTVRVVDESAIDRMPLSRSARGWLLLTALVTGLWGLALFITDAGPSTLIWAWPGDLLTSRLIGVMLLTIAAGSLYSMRWVGTARLMLAMTMAYSIGLALASLWNQAAGKPVNFAYFAVFGLLFLGSAGMMRLDRTLHPAVVAEARPV